MRVVSLNIGRPQLVVRDGRQYSTAIDRKPVTAAVQLDRTGFDGDRSADSESHGGADKAACCYPFEHYEHWRQRLGTELAPPAFGENLTTEGLTEDQVCVGDVLHVGGAVVQVSQPRQPCWKLASKHDTPQLPQWVNEVGFTGFYVRVLQSGLVAPGDTITLADRPHPGLTVLLTTRAMISRSADPDLLACLARVAELAASWRERLQKNLHSPVE